jgi:hypothetical protein
MWKNCGGDAAGFTDLTLTPDPLQFPGTLSITAKAFFSKLERFILGKSH